MIKTTKNRRIRYLCLLMIFRSKYMALVLLMTCSFACKKNESPESLAGIPDVPVDIYISLNEPAYFGLGVIGGYAYVDGGSRGIVVYRTATEYKAYERHTPYQAEKECARVSVDSTGSYAVDGCSDSRFLLLDGSVERGPATLPLIEYFTSENQGTLRIYK